MKKEHLIMKLAELFSKIIGDALENTEKKAVYLSDIYAVVLDYKDAESVTIQFLPEYNEIYKHTYYYNDPKFMKEVKKDYATFVQDLVDFYVHGGVKHEQSIRKSII